MDEVKETPERTQFLTFALADQAYAVGLLQVREIIEYEGVQPMPGTPASVRGVINLKGRAVPIVDLVRAFDLPSSPCTRETCILVFEVSLDGRQSTIGIAADNVSQVTGCTDEDVEEAPLIGTPIPAEFLKGLVRMEGQFIPILDVERTLGSPEFKVASTTRPPQVEEEETVEGSACRPGEDDPPLP